ncbi:MAG: aspartate aminotransferase family protein, partial [Acidimicrobiaceae bacterium]|nr:aspartate aminotransferase family protein [Acidimicrobiaceae bacterium]
MTSDAQGDLSGINDYFYPYRDRYPTYSTLPKVPVAREEVLDVLREMSQKEDKVGDEGKCSGSIYSGDHDHYRFLTEAFSYFAHSNVLQRDMYPSSTKLEGEIVAMTLSLLNGDA